MRMPFFARCAAAFRRGLTHRRLPVLLACLGMILMLPSLFSGLQIDDYLHREILLDRAAWGIRDASLFGLFSFCNGDPKRTHAMMDAGFMPWWTFEEVRAMFWRPVAEITHWLDYRLWPNSPALMHLQNLLWFGVIIWLISLLYRRILGATWIAGLAAFFFAVDNAHGAAVGWIANRNALIAACFGALALLAHDRWRRERWRVGVIAAPVAFLIGLLAGEIGLSAGAYLFAYALFLEVGTLRRRAMSLLPYAFVFAGWSAAYRHFGFGARGMGTYLDPGQQPLQFLRALIERAPMLLLGQMAEPPSHAYTILPPAAQAAMWLAALFVLGVMAFVLTPLLRKDAAARFFACGMMGSVVPICAVFPHNRLLFFVGIGGMGLVAQFLGAWRHERQSPETQRVPHSLRQKFTQWAAIMFLLIHGVFAPLTLPVNALDFAMIQQLLLTRFALKLPFDEKIQAQTTILINPPLTFFTIYFPFVRAERGLPLPARQYALMSGVLGAKIMRVNDRALEIEIPGGWLQIEFDRMFRGKDAPMRVGQRVALARMTAEVLSVTDEGQPVRVRFTFPAPLEDRTLRFVVWKNRQPVIFQPPSIGESETLPRLPFF